MIAQSNEETTKKFNNPQFTSKEYDSITIKSTGNLLVIRGNNINSNSDSAALRMRQPIRRFSESSRRRMGQYLRQSVAQYNVMVTLSYPDSYPTNGRIVKEHLRKFMQRIKRAAQNRTSTYFSDPTELMFTVNPSSYSAFWFLEFQQRGAPHFHIFTNCTYEKDWIAKVWYQIVNSEDERHLRAGTRIEFLRAGHAGAASYAAKYAFKMEQKDVPEDYTNSGRFWGVSGNKIMVAAATRISIEIVEKTSENQIRTNKYKLIREEIQRGAKCGSLELIKSDKGIVIYRINTTLKKQLLMWHINNYEFENYKDEIIDMDVEEQIADREYKGEGSYGM